MIHKLITIDSNIFKLINVGTKALNQNPRFYQLFILFNYTWLSKTCQKATTDHNVELN